MRLRRKLSASSSFLFFETYNVVAFLYLTMTISLSLLVLGGIVLAMSFTSIPFVVRAVQPVLEELDPALEQAAASLGSRGFTTFRRVIFPAIMPAWLGGVTTSFARSLGEFGATITFVSNIPGQTQTMPSAIYALLSTPSGEGPAMRLVLISVAIALAAVLVSEFLARRMAR